MKFLGHNIMEKPVSLEPVVIHETISGNRFVDRTLIVDQMKLYRMHSFFFFLRTIIVTVQVSYELVLTIIIMW